MRLKTKMLKKLISVLCAATVATSGVVTSVGAVRKNERVEQDYRTNSELQEEIDFLNKCLTYEGLTKKDVMEFRAEIRKLRAQIIKNKKAEEVKEKENKRIEACNVVTAEFRQKYTELKRKIDAFYKLNMDLKGDSYYTDAITQKDIMKRCLEMEKVLNEYAESEGKKIISLHKVKNVIKLIEQTTNQLNNEMLKKEKEGKVIKKKDLKGKKTTITTIEGNNNNKMMFTFGQNNNGTDNNGDMISEENNNDTNNILNLTFESLNNNNDNNNNEEGQGLGNNEGNNNVSNSFLGNSDLRDLNDRYNDGVFKLGNENDNNNNNDNNEEYQRVNVITNFLTLNQKLKQREGISAKIRDEEKKFKKMQAELNKKKSQFENVDNESIELQKKKISEQRANLVKLLLLFDESFDQHRQLRSITKSAAKNSVKEFAENVFTNRKKAFLDALKETSKLKREALKQERKKRIQEKNTIIEEDDNICYGDNYDFLNKITE